ncbi:MAG: Hpt domain-containing protein [Leptospiraceae bacterium]|nr:Hpt domain-containing protein [Leptospiraceae bacterium]
MIKRLISALGDIGVVPGLDEKESTQRRLLVYQGALMAIGGLVWGSLVLYFGIWRPAIIPYGYTILTILNFVFLYFTKNFRVARFFQVFISLLLPVAFQLLLGGFHVTGAVTLWSLLSLVSSITYQRVRSAVYWTVLYLILIGALAVLDGYFPGMIPEGYSAVLFALNISFVSLFIVALIIYFVVSKDRANQQLDMARRETETILNQVGEGLLLLDDRHIIQPSHSESALRILEAERIAGRNFAELIAGISGMNRESITDYLDLLFQGRLPARKLEFLNPLTDVEATIHTHNGSVKRHLQFQFTRIPTVDNKQTDRVFCSIADKTEAVRLENEIRQQEEKSRQRIEMISQLLSVRPALIHSFLGETEIELRDLSAFLQDNSDSKDFREILNRIYRCVHGIKGNAALLRLDYFVSICHRMEDTIDRLAHNSHLKALDLIEPVGDLDNLRRAALNMGEQFQQLKQFGADGDMDGELQLLQANLEDLIQSIAEREGKLVKMRFEADFELDHASLRLLRTTLVQLIRNSVVHGIETPDLRTRASKQPEGSIRVNIIERNEMLILTVQDDGAGIDFDRVRERINPEERNAESMSESELIRALFQPGFSTRQNASQDGGRGVGLDLLKMEIRRAGGIIKVRTGRNQGTTFTVELPFVETRTSAEVA